jgi:MerR family mercuric resistance operon transcriptional regulator
VRTGEVAEQAGVHVETLRYYERRGLLAAPQRSAGGYRDYPGAAVEVVRFVKRAQELGFALAEVEELLHLAEGGPEQCEAVRDAAAAKLADLDAKISDLTRMRASLAELVARCDLPRGARACSLLQALGSAGEGSAGEGSAGEGSAGEGSAGEGSAGDGAAGGKPS